MSERQPVSLAAAERSPRMRVMVEGPSSFPDKTYYCVFDAMIPADCTTIRAQGATLSLVGLWGDASLDLFDPKDIEPGTEISLDAEHPLHPASAQPRTVITQDGRVYHNLNLLSQRDLLESALTVVKDDRLEEVIFDPKRAVYVGICAANRPNKTNSGKPRN